MSIRSELSGAALLLLLLAGVFRPVAAQASGAAPASPRARAEQAMRTGQRLLLETRSPDAAQAAFLEAIQLDSTFAAPRFNLGVLAEAREQWDDAIRWFGEYLLLDRSSEWASRARVEIERARQIQALDRANAGPKKRQVAASLEIARRLLRAGNPREAMAEAERAAEIDPNDWRAPAFAAAVLLQQERWDEAHVLLGRAITGAEWETALRLTRVRSELEKYRPIHPATTLSADALHRFLRESVVQARKGLTLETAFPDYTFSQATTTQEGSYKAGVLSGPVLSGGGSLYYRPGEYKTLVTTIEAQPGRQEEVLAAVVAAVPAALEGWTATPGPDGSSSGTFTSPAGGAPVRVVVWKNPSGIVQIDVARYP